MSFFPFVQIPLLASCHFHGNRRMKPSKRCGTYVLCKLSTSGICSTSMYTPPKIPYFISRATGSICAGTHSRPPCAACRAPSYNLSSGVTSLLGHNVASIRGVTHADDRRQCRMAAKPSFVYQYGVARVTGERVCTIRFLNMSWRHANI